MKLTTLKSPLRTLDARPAKPLQTGSTRLRGRAGVERRSRWLYLHPLCVECEQQGIVTAAQEVDHIVALVNGGTDTDDNLQSLCREHHRAKTARDLGRRHKLGSVLTGGRCLRLEDGPYGGGG